MFKISIVLLFLLTGFGCKQHSEEIMNNKNCKEEVKVDSNLFDQPNSASFSIISADISGDCLQITIQSGGCSGSSWKAILIDAASIAKSNPPQRNIKLSLENKELCDALPTRSFSFDISKLQLEYSKKVILHLDGYEKPLEYSY